MKSLQSSLLLLALIAIPGIWALYQEKYSPKELKALQEFRPVVKHLLKKEYEKKDIYLIHWLRAKNLDIDEAKEMLEQNMIWRRENRMDEILEEKEMKLLLKRYPSVYGEAKDKDGRPAFQTSYSQWDIRKGMLAGHDFERLVAYNGERMSTLAYNSGHSQWVFLTDMNQYNLRQHACIACIKFYLDLVNQYENYYPNTAKLIYLINTPRVFEGVLQIITPLMSPHTRKILKVFGVNREEWQPAILQHFDPAQLPKAFGGTKV